jgi:hypothetical protein
MKERCNPRFGILGFITSRVSGPNININKLSICEKKGKVRPAFRDFGVQNFASSEAQNINIKKLSICEKRKGETLISRFRGSELHEFQGPKHQHKQTFDIPKVERMWDRHFRISGFGIS